MKDREFLIWIYYRLQNVHQDSPLFDYMHKLRAVITAIPKDQETPNDGRGENSIDILEQKINKTVEVMKNEPK